MWTRRKMLIMALAGAASLPSPLSAAEISQAEATGQLLARPGKPDPSLPPLTPGEAKREFGDRHALLYVPTTFRPEVPMPLMMYLHGTGGKATYSMRGWKNVAEKHGFLLLVPENEAPTWHLKKLPAGSDAVLFDNALAYVFARAIIDPRHLCIAGHSDGASTAMSVGLLNGDLFSHVMMFSGGSVYGRRGIGRPRLFISHGDQDDILPFHNAKTISDDLSNLGYDVTFREFHGGHGLPQDIVDEALAWFLD